MQHGFFYRFGKAVYRHRLATLVFWFILIGCSLPFLIDVMAPFSSKGFSTEHSESSKTEDYLNKELGYYKNRFILLYTSASRFDSGSDYRLQLKKALSGLKSFPIEHEIIYPAADSKQISKDKHAAAVVVIFKGSQPFNAQQLKQFRAALKTPRGMRLQVGGEAIFMESIEKQTQQDLFKSDAVAAPASVITLVFVFGALIAAFLPILLGGGCALLILSMLVILGYAFSLSVFTLNIALLLGLCLSLDYSIFMIFRFREELLHRHSIEEAIASTVGSAGRSVFFSGLAVFISLSALLLFPINILFSIGVGGLVAVFFAVLMAITFLPAILALLKGRINCFALPGIFDDSAKNEKSNRYSFWRGFAFHVIRYPTLYFIGLLCCLLMLGLPFLQVHLGISDLKILPPNSESYQFLQTYEKKFNANELTPITMVVSVKRDDILSGSNIRKLDAFVSRIKRFSFVERVDSIVTLDSDLSESQYEALYQLPKHTMAPAVRQYLKTTTGKRYTVVSIISKYDSNASKTLKGVEKLRNMRPEKGLIVRLTGTPVDNLDVMNCIKHHFPYAIVWIAVLTYFILFMLLRSLFLPLKAILMNLLSLTASYGVLVFVFQEGHFHEVLHFIPQGMLDVSMMIIIFCALFGFSMDYEVFLLSRIKEHYELTHHNDQSIVFGIEKSSKIITSAALIVIILCGSFMFAEVLMVKEFGLGIAIAIFVDAFIIRLFLVPATMALVKRLNWYCPAWLSKRH